jgi:hypothetical protein
MQKPFEAELFWELHEPSFPHRNWRIYAGGLVTRWDGQLVDYRVATDFEKDALYASLRSYMEMAEKR